MKKIIFTIALGLMISQISHALQGGENEGTSYCSLADYTCTQDGETALTSSLYVCVFKASIYLDLSGQSYHIPAAQLPVNPKMAGAGLTFAGDLIHLKIQTDAAPSPKGWPSYVSVPSLGVNEGNLRCHPNWKKNVQ
jgi:hypothetical protein